jgi:hypothetical protein
MTKEALLNKLTAAIDDALRQRMFGTLEIEFRAGEPVFFRKHQQEKLDTETENRREQTFKRS